MKQWLSALGLSVVCAMRAGAAEVVIYSSVDDVFARPIAERYQKQTGIEVKLVPDTEETKSTGLLNRLIAERKRPVADVFWSGDPARAAVLKAKGISAPYASANAKDLPKSFSDAEQHWTGFSSRARVIIYNKNVVAAGNEPKSVLELGDPKWKGKGCLANPLFGTTSMHAAALFQVLGDARARDFFNKMKANGVAVLSSNGEVKRRVAAGDFAFGLTDTDDVNVAMKEGKPVNLVFPDQDGMGALIVPNCAVLIANAPHAAEGKKFIDYLLTAKVEQALAESEAAQMPVRKGVKVPSNVRPLDGIKAMQVDYERLAAQLEELSRGFLKTWASGR